MKRLKRFLSWWVVVPLMPLATFYVISSVTHRDDIAKMIRGWIDRIVLWNDRVLMGVTDEEQ